MIASTGYSDVEFKGDDMKFDLLSESRISLNELAREQNVAPCTAWRWCLRGIGAHHLESLSVGGRKFTTREAFARFIARINGKPNPSSPNRKREKERRAARKHLVDDGLISAATEVSEFRGAKFHQQDSK